jgi:hypothetical protein
MKLNDCAGDVPEKGRAVFDEGVIGRYSLAVHDSA